MDVQPWGPAATNGQRAAPATGQTKCYDETGGEIPCPPPGAPLHGQDPQHPGTPRSYTKLGRNGVALPQAATGSDGWIMTRDNTTGLVWEVKTDRDGSADYTNPHDADNTYTWYDGNPAANGGYPGVAGGGPTTEEFIAALNRESFGGFSDWRMPAVQELSTLANSGIGYPGPTVDAPWMPLAAGGYWSATTYARYPNDAWRVPFDYGYVYNYSKSYRHHALAVRGRPPEGPGELVDNGDGTVTDARTGLLWQKETVPGTHTWRQALALAEASRFGGFADWRLPNRNELQSLVDYSRYHPAIAPLLAPPTIASDYWSSTTAADDKSQAWRVYFFNGYVAYSAKSSSLYVRLVRTAGMAQPGAARTGPARPAAADTDGASAARTGHDLSCGLWARAVRKAPAGDATLFWKPIGQETTADGTRIIAGYFHADPAQGGAADPQVFVKGSVDPTGLGRLMFYHAAADPVFIESAHSDAPRPHQSGLLSAQHHLLEHTYTGVRALPPR